MTYQSGRYAINEGAWYRVDESFKLSIEETFQSSVQPWITSPPPLRKIYDQHGNGSFQTEASYNSELAQHFGFILLDQMLIEIPGLQRSGFEACDLLDIQGKRLIHVKKSSRRSSVLSHFFKQGGNSAQQLKRFPAAWDALFNAIARQYGQSLAQSVLDLDRQDLRRWTVEFWIADSPRVNGEHNIPFFSKISFRDEASSLLAMNYDVSVKFIALEPMAQQSTSE